VFPRPNAKPPTVGGQPRDIQAKTVLEKSLTDCPLEVRLTAEV